MFLPGARLVHGIQRLRLRLPLLFPLPALPELPPRSLAPGIALFQRRYLPSHTDGGGTIREANCRLRRPEGKCYLATRIIRFIASSDSTS